MQEKKLNILNKKLGKLTALKELQERDKNRYVKWLCKCECGKEKIVTASQLKRGAVKSCGCLHSKASRKNGKLTQKKKGEASFNALLTNYKYGAKKRNITFNLTNEQFRKITSEKCHYCGIEPKQTRVTDKRYNGCYLYNGIDRINNNIGYIYNNCRPCCGNCNRAKYNKTEKEFEEYIERTYNHLRKK